MSARRFDCVCGGCRCAGKGVSSFVDEKPGVRRHLTPFLLHPKVNRKPLVLLNTPPGVYYGKIRFCFAHPVTAWAISFPKGIFVFPDGFYGRYRPEEKHTVRRAVTKNSGSPFRRFPLLGINRTGAGCRSCYFQSLKISSIALSIAAFRLFSTIRLSSA